MRLGRRVALGLMGAAAAAAVGIPLWADAGPGPPPLLPDLVSDPPDNVHFDTFDRVQGHAALLIRFNGYVHNAGAGPLDIEGDPQLAPGAPGAMSQYLWNGTGARNSDATGNPGGWSAVTDVGPPVVKFETSDTHNHFHVQRAAEYSLWDATETVRVAPGSKVGFCQYDTERVDPAAPAVAVYGDAVTGTFCRQNQPEATQLREGITDGYRDTYDFTLDYQWVDVSDVQPGVYHLAARMDPDNVLKESDETNNGYAYSTPVVVPGYVARAVGPVTTAYRTAVAVPLQATAFATAPDPDPAVHDYGSVLGDRTFRIESLPANGVLRNADGAVLHVGSLLVGATQVTYQPGTGASGADGFTYSALNTGVNGTPYPLHPAVATASVVVGESGITVVSLTGVPRQITTGAQVRLGATASDGGGLVWSATGARISSGGVLTAPDAVPAGGTVSVRVAAADDPRAVRTATIRVVAPSVTGPVPQVPPPLGRAVLSRPGLLVNGRRVTTTYRVGVTGTLRVTLRHNRLSLGTCANRALAGQTVSCRFILPSPYDPATVTAEAVLTRAHRRVARTVSTLGPSSFRRVSVRRAGRRVRAVVTPQRPGFATLILADRGVVVGRCAQRVLPDASLSCERILPTGVGADPVMASVVFRDPQGRLAVRDLMLTVH
ncbi:MAG: lysyl oxidase family protein [Thermoleophilia bacterium]